MLSKELKDEILEAIDRGNWKYTWHLELSHYGNIDFNSEKNLSKMIEVLERERDFGIEVAARASRLLPLLSAQLRRAVDRWWASAI
jgi:hypothetical protein